MSLNLDALRSVRRIITHRRPEGLCADAVASALILRDALGPIPVSFVEYGSAELREIEPEDGLLFVDMTPHVERDHGGALTPNSHAYLLRLAAAGTIVLDHHKGAADVVRMFGERGVFADEAREPGVSGGTLAYLEVWGPLYRASPVYGQRRLDAERAYNLGVLAGVRDTWQRKDPRWREACEQACVLAFFPVESLSLGPDLDAKMAIGAVLLARDEERARRCLAGAARFDVDGTREAEAMSGRGHRFVKPIHVIAFEGVSHDASDVADLASDAGLVLAWHYEIVEGRPTMRVSIRSRGVVNCAAFAMLFGGNGHSGAGGFSVAIDAANPYTQIRSIVEMGLTAL